MIIKRASAPALVAIVVLLSAIALGEPTQLRAKDSAPSADTVVEAVNTYWTSVSAMDIEGVLATFAEDAVSHDPYGAPPIASFEERRQALRALAERVESLQFNQDSVHVSGNRAAVRWSSTARLKDGRRVSFEGIDVFEINSEGKIQTLWGYWDPRVLFASN